MRSVSTMPSIVSAADTSFKRQMRGGERDAQRPLAGAGQHHHHARRVGALGEIFGVAGERHAGIVDGAFLQRRGDDRVELPASAPSIALSSRSARSGRWRRRACPPATARRAADAAREPALPDRAAPKRRPVDADRLGARSASRSRIAQHGELRVGPVSCRARQRLRGQFGADAGGLAGRDRDLQRGAGTVWAALVMMLTAGSACRP